jgi:hypothetical protein
MEESKDDDLNVDGTAETTLADVPVVEDTTAAAETTLDDVPAVKDTTAAALTDTAHGDDDAASVGSSSPPFLSSPDSIVPLTGTAPPPSDTFILDCGASTPPPTLPIGDLPATAANGMATLQRALSDHLAELDRQRFSIGEKYDTLHDLLVKAQTEFNASAIAQRVQSAVGAHSAELIELIANAEAAIDVKYNNISAMHTALKSALSKALTLVDASTLSRRALAVFDNAVKAAVAPGGMLAERIGEEIMLAVTDAVDRIVAREINLCIHETLDNVFTSYRDCVLTERHLAEMELKTYFQAQQELARTEYQGFLKDSTSASITKIEATLDAGEARLDTTLRSTEWALDRKGTSVVAAITSARLPSTPPTPAPVTPLLTSLGTRADNATPVGASRGAWGNSPRHSTPATSSPHASNPSKSPIVDATRDRTQHGGVHPGHLDSPQCGGAPPVDPSALGFASGSRVHFDKDSSRSGGAHADHNRPSRLSGTHDGSPPPNPTGLTLHKTPPTVKDRA